MTVRVSLEELFEQLPSWGFCYLLTSSADGARPHLLALHPEVVVTVEGTRALRFDAGTGRGRRNAADRPDVAIVFPPRDPAVHPEHAGFSLVVDGEASPVVEPGAESLIDVVPVSAMLHRPAPTGPPASHEMSLHDVVTLEATVWEALVAGDPAADRERLSDDFLGIYPSGFAGRAEHAAELDDGPTVVEYEIRSPVLRAVGPDHVLLAYEAAYRRPGSGAERMYVSSVWERRADGWVNVFSQDTPAAGDQ